jgi:hypothetical protein
MRISPYRAFGATCVLGCVGALGFWLAGPGLRIIRTASGAGWIAVAVILAFPVLGVVAGLWLVVGRPVTRPGDG